MRNDQTKKTIEPFNLFGERSWILSKKDAANILTDNSYYIFVAAFITLGVFLFLTFKPVDIGYTKTYLLIFSIFYFVLGVAIRRLQSRIASILALLSFGLVVLSKILEQNLDFFTFISFIFLAASYRSVKASFFYHKTSS